MGLFKDYVSQTRKPEGFLGKMMVNGMNGGHARMAECRDNKGIQMDHLTIRLFNFKDNSSRMTPRAGLIWNIRILNTTCLKGS